MKYLEVIVIDDEPAIRQILAAQLLKKGYHVCQAANGLSAYERIAKGDIDVAICDIKMPDISGIELVRRVRAAGLETNFIMMTAFASVDTAIEAIQAGASDYMIKPVRNEEALHRLVKIVDMRGLRAENLVLRNLLQGQKEDFFPFTSPCMRELERLINKVAPTDSTVLVTGESGTGKGVIARRLHQLSPRAQEAFIPVNCGALPENLMESELFGHTKGAFTGADKARKGLFQEAHHGTIFLDEIGELPLQLQVKLLHVIDEKTIRPVGSEQSRQVDVRIVAATNRDLEQMVKDGRFREDLYFRLTVFHIHAPPLRDRHEDFADLLSFFLERGSKRILHGVPTSIDAKTSELLAHYAWPGNVREMENVIDRALILAEDGQITFEDLPASLRLHVISGSAAARTNGADNLRDQVRRFESEVICTAISASNGDRKAVAQKLGIGLSSLYRKLEEFDAFGLLPAELKEDRV
jgi:two-component system response regulator AtoC